MVRALVVLMMLVGSVAHAETFGAWEFDVPADYIVISDQAELRVYSRVDESHHCLLALYPPTVHAGSLADAATAAWKDVVETDYTATGATKAKTRKTTHKLSVSSRSATLTGDMEGFRGTLHVILGNGMAGSVFVFAKGTDTAKTCGPTAKTFIDSIVVDAKASAAFPAQRWARSVAGTKDSTTTGSYTGSGLMEYTFAADGTYTFRSEYWGGQGYANQWYVRSESGTWKAEGATVTVTPKTTAGEIRDGDGKAIRAAKPKAEVATYQWQSAEKELVLTIAKVTARDGSFAASDKYPTSYLYSSTYQPQWKFAD